MIDSGKMDNAKDLRFWYNGTNDTDTELQSTDSYLLVFEDIDQYFSKINLSNGSIISEDRQLFNCSYCVSNSSNVTSSLPQETLKNYWALILVLFPIFTLFGNVLVILSVYRERTLQTATNYFIVSLALADLLVAVVVMPFAVYVLVSPVLHFLYTQIIFQLIQNANSNKLHYSESDNNST